MTARNRSRPAGFVLSNLVRVLTAVWGSVVTVVFVMLSAIRVMLTLALAGGDRLEILMKKLCQQAENRARELLESAMDEETRRRLHQGEHREDSA